MSDFRSDVDSTRVGPSKSFFKASKVCSHRLLSKICDPANSALRCAVLCARWAVCASPVLAERACVVSCHVSSLLQICASTTHTITPLYAFFLACAATPAAATAAAAFLLLVGAAPPQ